MEGSNGQLTHPPTTSGGQICWVHIPALSITPAMPCYQSILHCILSFCMFILGEFFVSTASTGNPMDSLARDYKLSLSLRHCQKHSTHHHAPQACHDLHNDKKIHGWFHAPNAGHAPMQYPTLRACPLQNLVHLGTWVTHMPEPAKTEFHSIHLMQYTHILCQNHHPAARVKGPLGHVCQRRSCTFHFFVVFKFTVQISWPKSPAPCPLKHISLGSIINDLSSDPSTRQFLADVTVWRRCECANTNACHTKLLLYIRCMELPGLCINFCP